MSFADDTYHEVYAYIKRLRETLAWPRATEMQKAEMCLPAKTFYIKALENLEAEAPAILGMIARDIRTGQNGKAVTTCCNLFGEMNKLRYRDRPYPGEEAADLYDLVRMPDWKGPRDIDRLSTPRFVFDTKDASPSKVASLIDIGSDLAAGVRDHYERMAQFGDPDMRFYVTPLDFYMRIEAYNVECFAWCQLAGYARDPNSSAA